MKTTQSTKKSGNALITALLFTFMAAAVVSAYVAYSANDARMTQRMIDYQKAKIAAECALEHGVLSVRDVVLRNQLGITPEALNLLFAGITPPADLGPYRYLTPDGNTAFEVSIDTEVQEGEITKGAACLGSSGQYQYYTVKAGAINPQTGVGAVMKQQVQGVGLALIRFGVFYERDLEINPGATMNFSGPVHANGDLYMSPDGSTLSFHDRVTSHGDMYRYRKDKSGTTGVVAIDNNNGYATTMSSDSTDPYWMINSIWLWGGRVQSKSHGVQKLSPPINPVDQPHDLIERPLAVAASNYNAETEGEKFYNKACLRISVSSNKVFTAVDSRGVDMTFCFTNPAALVTNGTYSSKPLFTKNANGTYKFYKEGAYDVSQNNFYDAREGCYMRPVDIYVDQLLAKFPAVADLTYSIAEGRGVVYVTRDDPDAAHSGYQPCLRIRNGVSLPSGGLTFASDLPIYIEGDYNTNHEPALAVGDAVTVLSRNWQDAKSAACLSDRVASNVNVNVVIMTGNSETYSGRYNGGLENVIRFLEGWSGKTVNYSGAIIDLWYSEAVTNCWSYSAGYYTAPTRNWSYDEIYRTQVPPGMTHVFGLEEITWTETTWANEGWN